MLRRATTGQMGEPSHIPTPLNLLFHRFVSFSLFASSSKKNQGTFLGPSLSNAHMCIGWSQMIMYSYFEKVRNSSTCSGYRHIAHRPVAIVLSKDNEQSHTRSPYVSPTIARVNENVAKVCRSRIYG